MNSPIYQEQAPHHHSRVGERIGTLLAAGALVASGYVIGIMDNHETHQRTEVATAEAGGGGVEINPTTTTLVSEISEQPNGMPQDFDVEMPNSGMPPRENLSSDCNQKPTLKEEVDLSTVLGSKVFDVANSTALEFKQHACENDADLDAYRNDPERAEIINTTMLQLANALRLLPASINDQEFQQTPSNVKIINYDDPESVYHVDAMIEALNEDALNHPEGYFDTYIKKVSVTIKTSDGILSMTLAYENGGQVIVSNQGFYNPDPNAGKVAPIYDQTGPTTTNPYTCAGDGTPVGKMSVSNEAVQYAGGGAECAAQKMNDNPVVSTTTTSIEQMPSESMPMGQVQSQTPQMMKDLSAFYKTALEQANAEIKVVKDAKAAVALLSL